MFRIEPLLNSTPAFKPKAASEIILIRITIPAISRNQNLLPIISNTYPFSSPLNSTGEDGSSLAINFELILGLLLH